MCGQLAQCRYVVTSVAGDRTRDERRDTTRRLYLLAVLLADRFQRRRTLRIESIPDFRRC